MPSLVIGRDDLAILMKTIARVLSDAGHAAEL
jgi:hypothetical protein